jgi:hypothetical protein
MIPPEQRTYPSLPGRAIPAASGVALLASFLIISALGSWFIVRHWRSRPEGQLAGGSRALLFVGIMALVHVAGFRALHEQGRARTGTPGMKGLAEQSTQAYRLAIRVALLQQIPILVLTSLMLDGGRALRIWGIVLLAHWLAVLLIVMRRAERPAPSDLAMIRYGFWLILIAVVLFAPLVSRIVGAT